jgi:predicted transcriptional regulator
MPVIKSYYKTTPITDELLVQAIASAKDQENKIYQIFKKYGCMTTWDVYDVYNELVCHIIPSSVGRSINTLLKQGVIYSLGTIPGDNGRPVNLYEISDRLPEVIERRHNQQIPKSIKLDLKFTEDGSIDIDTIVADLDLLLSKISVKFNINY